MNEPAIRCLGLTVSLGNRVVLRDINLDLHPGESGAVLGHNGAGKSTLLRAICGLIRPSQGFCAIGGHRADHNRIRNSSLIGYMPEMDILYRERSVLQNLIFHAAVRNCSGEVLSQRVSSALTESNTATVRDRRIAELSAGWRRMAQLACAIVHKPRILLLDEPCAGLDWAARNRLWRIVRKLKDTGASVIIATQEVREARRCDRTIVLADGRIAAQGTQDSLTPGEGLEMPAVVSPSGDKTQNDRIVSCPEAFAVLGEPPNIRVIFQSKGAALEAMKRLGITATDFSLVSPSLEEIYIGVTCASRNRPE